MGLDATPTGEAQIREIFHLKTRGGWALVLEEDFTGRVYVNGIIESDRGSASYKGPEYMDRISEGKAWVAVVIKGESRSLFEVGQWVKFYKQQSLSDNSR
jgi:hypothetical protein